MGPVFRGWRWPGRANHGRNCAAPDRRGRIPRDRAATFVLFFFTLFADAEGKANELDWGLVRFAEAERLVSATEERYGTDGSPESDP